MAHRKKDPVKEEFEQHEEWLAKLPGVTSVGIGKDDNGQDCISLTTNDLPVETKRAIESKVKAPVTYSDSGGDFYPLNL